MGAHWKARAHQEDPNCSPTRHLIRPYSPPVASLSFFGVRNSRSVISDGRTTSKNPNIISSRLCSPKRTSAAGSGFFGLFGELSNQALHEIVAPAGTISGFSNL